MDTITILGIIGSLASIISIPVAIVQTIKNNKLKTEAKRKIWAQIETVKALMRCLDIKDVDFAYGLVNEQFRNLLQEASLLEKEYSIETIEKWRKIGKLSSDWQERNAYMLLDTKKIDLKKEINKNFSVYDDASPYAKMKEQEFLDSLKGKDQNEDKEN